MLCRLKEQATLIHAGREDLHDREHQPIEFTEINGEAEASVALAQSADG